MSAAPIGLLGPPATGLPAGAPGRGPSSPAEVGLAFSALVEESLATGQAARHTGETQTKTETTTETEPGTEDDTTAEDTPGPALEGELAALLAGLITPVPAALTLALAGGEATAGVDAAATTPLPGPGLPAAGAASVEVADVATPAGELGAPQQPPTAAAGPALDVPSPLSLDPASQPAPDTLSTPVPGPAAEEALAALAPSTTSQDTSALATATGSVSSAETGAEHLETTRPAPTAETATVPVVAGGAVTVTATAGGQAPVGEPTPAPVAAQVIPEITRLVSDGEGVHRVTLALNPRALGEVRVTLTMRNGEVHVRLAAGEQARASLASSSSELSRALHGLGVEGTRITLTDLQGVTTTTTRTSSDDHPGDSRHQTPFTGGSQADSRGHDGHHSRMSDDNAMDGSSTSTPADRARAAARIQPVGHARVAGDVDLRM